MKQVAYDYLMKNELLNIDMLEVMRHEDYQLLYASFQGVLLYCQKADALMLSVDDFDLGEKLIIEYSKKYPVIVLHQIELEEIAKRYLHIHERIECYQQVFSECELINLPEDVIIKTVTLNELELICHHYSHDSDPDYLAQIIKDGWMYGLYVDEKLAGFIGRHHEGSMGILEVLPQYKRKHYATYLLNFIIHQFQAKGWTAFSQVEVDNVASLNLHQKFKAQSSKLPILWLV